MKSEEMKRKKFEILVRDIDEYFGDTGLSSYYREVEETDELEGFSPLEFFIEKNEKNPWLTTIFNNTFNYDVFRGDRACHELDKKLCEMLYKTEEDLNDILENNTIWLLEGIRKCNKCTYDGTFCKPAHCNMAYHLLFWLIFAMSVDNENYNNNLSVVSDVAFILDFDEDMLKDWITAVKGVLSGKKLPELDYKTKAGKEFFVRH